MLLVACSDVGRENTIIRELRTRLRLPLPEQRRPEQFNDVVATFGGIAAGFMLPAVMYVLGLLHVGNFVRDDAKAAVQKDADWLKRWTSTKVMIEGHCDERGTAEYNLALGERRAQAVRDYLVSLGVAAARVQTVSKGKEQPFCDDKNESCWQQNRRGHFVITAK